jgi:hypothetical protein
VLKRRTYMKKESTHSQDYDRKHGNDHIVIDKASLREDFIDSKRKPADTKDWSRHIQKSDKDEKPV